MKNYTVIIKSENYEKTITVKASSAKEAVESVDRVTSNVILGSPTAANRLKSLAKVDSLF